MWVRPSQAGYLFFIYQYPCSEKWTDFASCCILILILISPEYSSYINNSLENASKSTSNMHLYGEVNDYN